MNTAFGDDPSLKNDVSAQHTSKWVVGITVVSHGEYLLKQRQLCSCSWKSIMFTRVATSLVAGLALS